jgi:pimeloyl-ACP methyl ester carboxylesterase
VIALHLPFARPTAQRLFAVAVLAASIACTGRQASLPAAEGYVTSRDGVQIFYRTAGAGDPLVVVHGGPGFDHGYLAPGLEPLAESHRLVFYDQRGAGRSTIVSDAGLLGLDAHIADLEAVRRHFALERVTLLGHSWGAMLAAGYAMAHPDEVAKLVMVSPGGVRHDPYEAELMATVTAWMVRPLWGPAFSRTGRASRISATRVITLTVTWRPATSVP